MTLRDRWLFKLLPRIPSDSAGKRLYWAGYIFICLALALYTWAESSLDYLEAHRWLGPITLATIFGGLMCAASMLLALGLRKVGTMPNSKFGDKWPSMMNRLSLWTACLMLLVSAVACVLLWHAFAVGN